MFFHFVSRLPWMIFQFVYTTGEENGGCFFKKGGVFLLAPGHPIGASSASWHGSPEENRVPLDTRFSAGKSSM